MKCKGEFIFRGIERRDGGNFINDKGETISYKPSYKLKVDEQTENGLIERIFKISEEQVDLISIVQTLDNYSKIIILFDITFYGTKINLVLEDVELA